MLACVNKNKFIAVNKVLKRETRKFNSGESRLKNNTSHLIRRRFYRDTSNNVKRS
jgi:hypothetical protein